LDCGASALQAGLSYCDEAPSPIALYCMLAIVSGTTDAGPRRRLRLDAGKSTRGDTQCRNLNRDLWL